MEIDVSADRVTPSSHLKGLDYVERQATLFAPTTMQHDQPTQSRPAPQILAESSKFFEDNDRSDRHPKHGKLYWYFFWPTQVDGITRNVNWGMLVRHGVGLERLLLGSWRQQQAVLKYSSLQPS